MMGDDGKLYVPAENVAVFRERLIPCADYIFPNQTEAEMLADVKIASVSDALRCVDRLHAMGPSLVVITSSALGNDDNSLLLLGSWRRSQSSHNNDTSSQQVERFEVSSICHMNDAINDCEVLLL